MKTFISGVIAAVGLLLFMLGSAGHVQAQGGDDPGAVADGKAVYEASCAGCHAADGTGVAQRGRPLIGIASQGDRATHVASVTDGKGGMPAFGERLEASEIDQAISYVRLTFVEEAAAADETADAEPTELALTGVGSTALAIVGITMLLGGLQLVVWSRRES